jgi:hypothetical protein
MYQNFENLHIKMANPIQATKIILDDKPIGKKSLNLKDNLIAIRKNITEKVKEDFIFLDIDHKDISLENEENFILEQISKQKTIYIKKVETNRPKIKILVNKKEICSINYSESQKLQEIRNLLQDIIKQKFIFLDDDENDVEIEDEINFTVSDILTDNSINLKVDSNNILITPSNKNDEIEKNKDEYKGKQGEETKKVENLVKITDFSKYEIIDRKEDLTIYKYSNVPKVSKHELIYEYFYDKLDEQDIQDACVILFCGKTGDGKTTAINALFNIIKGVKLEDNYRFILITETPKATGQAESQTDGVHLYYLKDYRNKPVILIDSQGYGDTRNKSGINYDQKIDGAFSYVFSEMISHINAVIFIIKSNTNRIDSLTSYIYASVTKLFAEDMSTNFIVLATFADRQSINSRPAIISSFETQPEFKKLQEKLDQNWWFTIDSTSILDNEKDKLTMFSYQKAENLYNNKIKKLVSRRIEKSSEIIKSRIESRILVDQLNTTFIHLVAQQENLEIMEKNIDIKIEETKRLEKNLNDLENDMNRLDPKELEEKLSELNNEINMKLDDFLNEKVEEIIQTLVPSGSYYNTVCHNCKRNCESDCECLFSIFGRCKIFTFFSHRCEVCGCAKGSHKRDKYKYEFVKREKQKHSDYEISQEKQKNENRKRKILSDIDKNNNARSNLEKKINEFNTNKKILLLEQEKIKKEKEEIQKKIKNINNQIIFIIIKLQGNSEKIVGNAMVDNFTKKEDDYIDDLINQMDTMNIREQEKIKKIKQIKENNRIFRQMIQIDKKDLLKLDDAQLAGLLKIIIPNYKK